MAGNDLIGPKQAPSGDIVGLYARIGDQYFPLGNGPVIACTDPIAGTTRYFRMNVYLQNNGDGTTTPIPTLEEVLLT